MHTALEKSHDPQRGDATPRSWLGPDALARYVAAMRARREPAALDVVLLTHPRDEDDMSRLFADIDRLSRRTRAQLLRLLRPAFGEIVELPALRVGIYFMPFTGADCMDPQARSAARKLMSDEALPAVARSGARVMCLGGLSGSLTGYGKRIKAAADACGVTLTTGHSLTVVTIVNAYLRAVAELELDPAAESMTILGAGSIGRGVAELVARHERRPRSIALVDLPSRAAHVRAVAERLRATTRCEITTELTDARGALPADGSCYRSRFLISATSMPNIVDVARVSPGCVLIDDSQPYCWPRDAAWARVTSAHDIAPCDAGLVDCSSLGYRARFPFDFADHGETGSSIAWSCLTEGLLRALHPELPETIGEPSAATLDAYAAAFDRAGLTVPPLQCGAHLLPIPELRARMRELAAGQGARS
jgi:predicted amino acid dehydrogenase